MTSPKPAAKPLPVYGLRADAASFVLLRDTKPCLTPDGREFSFPTETLAAAVMAEWVAGGAKPDARKMPLTQLAATALDRLPHDRATIINSLVAYVGSELLCHRAPDGSKLATRQNDVWQPLLDWAADSLGAALQIGMGIMPVKQSIDAAEALRSVIAAYDDYHLAGLRHAVDSCGSLILGLALARGRLTADQVFAAAELESLTQSEQWGEDPVTISRHAHIRRELDLCQQWFALLAGHA